MSPLVAHDPGDSATPFLRRLHVHIGLVTLAIFLAMAAASLWFTRAQQERANLESTQRMNLGLARYIVDHQPRPLLTDAGSVDLSLVRTMAMDVMMTNPALEVYLLDRNGLILAHAIEGVTLATQRVDLRPVVALLADHESPKLPLLGDDPRQPSQPNVFSVAAIGADPAAPTGYLYVVLRGQAARGLSLGIERSTVMRETILVTTLAFALAALALIASQFVLTRPLRRLTAQVHGFREQGSTSSTHQANGEIAMLEQAIKAMQSRIAEQFQQIDESDRLRRELVSNLSHDLMTPLASIQGYVERCILRNQTLAASEREHNLRVVLRHCESLRKRAGDLFELSKLDAGQLQPKWEVVCLSELLHDITLAYQLQAERLGIALQLTDSSRSDVCVRADIALLERAIQNLIDNALRFTPRGGQILVDVAPDQNGLRVAIIDSGTGIAEDHLAHVFERYWRVPGATATEPGLTSGLGLAIVKRILDLHDSVIEVRSALGCGSRFEFTLTPYTATL